MITIKAKGLAETLANIKALPRKMQREIEFSIHEAARLMVRNAKRDAPVDQSILRSEITEFKFRELTWKVVSQAGHSGFVEFGTKSRVQIPAGLEEEAAKIKGQKNQSSLGAKEAIFQWCKRHNIEQSAWYPIYLSIMAKGIHPRPFFFKQIAIIEPMLIKQVTAIVNEQRL